MTAAMRAATDQVHVRLGARFCSRTPVMTALHMGHTNRGERACAQMKSTAAFVGAYGSMLQRLNSFRSFPRQPESKRDSLMLGQAH
jgi:hypothetical protein